MPASAGWMISRTTRACSSGVTAGAGEHDEARLFALEEFLDHDAVARRAHRALDQNPVDRLMGLGWTHRDDHAVSRREAVGLHDERRAARVDMIVRRSGLVEARERRGGNPVPPHE